MRYLVFTMGMRPLRPGERIAIAMRIDWRHGNAVAFQRDGRQRGCDRVLQLGPGPLLRELAAADIQALDSGKFVGWKRTGRASRAFDAPGREREPGLPLLHSAGAGRLAFLLGFAYRMRADRGDVPDVRRGIPAVMYVDLPERRPAPAPPPEHRPYIACGTTAPIPTMLHDRPQPAHADGRARLDRRRLRARTR